MSEHYYTEKPQSEIRESRFDWRIAGNTLTFVSVSGVFAFGSRVDKASELLIAHFKPSGVHPSVLDVGCGYGPIALFIKARYPHLDVTALDINERAVAYAAKNADLNNLHVRILKSDLYNETGDRQYGDIVSNPPLAAGKAVTSRLIEEAARHLYPGGALQLVAYHNKGGETLKRMMEETFGNVEDVVKSGGIRVYRSVRTD
ncbi:MAG TPA: methyltransferase [Thermoclostridium caenicola]|uniref:16S rRNA m(2)G 1207 methyltransferase n=1 Tax=Thermoclostridium caenicola TaxID=659425 RepID=A0A1M6I6Z8_9FIRM|nr:methyltransferase [Thermoclostridium caenicola]SHJ30220.1 16S rRNA m(2)G 1207 methyltransferase [Thermoclostridium caenicola]HOK42447.1 methyltransferase [Thermoclostridium caenicola]HOL84777.1 methyltransferase [Thermoclostridium caenicola]HOP72061.1 methyltransferase [Thermoclostridium caenicola]HPO76967.1 methyltransferase [Thermoclostridium caenicola]